jgi:PhnB protein
LERNKLPSGFHVQAQIGDSVMVLSAMDPPYAEATRGSIDVYVPDVDATYQRALAAGGSSIAQPTDKLWKAEPPG